MLKVVYSDEATRILARIPRPTAERIVAKIEQYAAEPESLAANVKTLTGRGGRRLRVGKWRVLFAVVDGTMTIYKIAPRGSAYD